MILPRWLRAKWDFGGCGVFTPTFIKFEKFRSWQNPPALEANKLFVVVLLFLHFRPTVSFWVFSLLNESVQSNDWSLDYLKTSIKALLNSFALELSVFKTTIEKCFKTCLRTEFSWDTLSLRSFSVLFNKKNQQLYEHNVCHCLIAYLNASR